MSHDPRSPSLSFPSATLSDEQRDSYQPYGLEEYYGEVINTLTFRLKDGNRFAKPYHLLHESEFDPSTGIRLYFADGTVTLTGSNMEPLFTLISEFRVRWVLEAGRSESLRASGSAIVVEAIRRERR